MAKKLLGQLKLQIPAGSANPSPPVGPALGQRGINIMEFCKAFNAKTQDLEKGVPLPVVIDYYQDKSFHLHREDAAGQRAPEAAAKLKSGSKEPGPLKRVGKVTMAQCREIAEQKMPISTPTDLDDGCRRSLPARPARWALKWWRTEGYGYWENATVKRAPRWIATPPIRVDDALQSGQGKREGQVRRNRRGGRETRGRSRNMPTRWCAAWSRCLRAPARPCGWRSSRAMPRQKRRAKLAPMWSVPRILMEQIQGGRHGIRPRDRLARHDEPSWGGSARCLARAG